MNCGRGDLRGGGRGGTLGGVKADHINLTIQRAAVQRAPAPAAGHALIAGFEALPLTCLCLPDVRVARRLTQREAGDGTIRYICEVSCRDGY